MMRNGHFSHSGVAAWHECCWRGRYVVFSLAMKLSFTHLIQHNIQAVLRKGFRKSLLFSLVERCCKTRPEFNDPVGSLGVMDKLQPSLRPTAVRCRSKGKLDSHDWCAFRFFPALVPGCANSLLANHGVILWNGNPLTFKSFFPLGGRWPWWRFFGIDPGPILQYCPYYHRYGFRSGHSSLPVVVKLCVCEWTMLLGDAYWLILYTSHVASCDDDLFTTKRWTNNWIWQQISPMLVPQWLRDGRRSMVGIVAPGSPPA